MMRLIEIIIRNGLSDIEHNSNPYGVARRLLEIIIQYRSYKSVYNSIEAGFKPYGLDMPPGNAIIYHHSVYGKHYDDILYDEDYYDKGLYSAAKGNQSDLMKLFIHHGADYNYGMLGAIAGNNMKLVQHFIDKGANWWNKGMIQALKGQNREMIKFYMDLTDNMYTWAFYLAAIEGHHIDLAEQRNAFGSWPEHELRAAARGGHFDLVKQKVEEGARNWNWGMCFAAEGGHMNLVKFFIDKGADDYDWAICKAASRGHMNLVKFFIDKGATDLYGAASAAYKGGCIELYNYLQDLYYERTKIEAKNRKFIWVANIDRTPYIPRFVDAIDKTYQDYYCYE